MRYTYLMVLSQKMNWGGDKYQQIPNKRLKKSVILTKLDKIGHRSNKKSLIIEIIIIIASLIVLLLKQLFN